MKWFKHLSGSLNNSFIYDLVSKFGGDGYLVFFGTIELMADEFDIHNPGLNEFPFKKLTASFQLSKQKTRKILDYIHQKSIENLRKTDGKLAEFCEKTNRMNEIHQNLLKKKNIKHVGFFVRIDRDWITVICPKLKDLCDEYAKKKLAKKSGQNPDKVQIGSGFCQEQDSDSELEVDYKDKRSQAAFAAPGGDHFANKVGEHLNGIMEQAVNVVELAKKSTNGSRKFNVYQWIQNAVNNNMHPAAILDTLNALVKYWKSADNKWTYANAIIKTRSQNYREREHMADAAEFKVQWWKACQQTELKSLITGVGH